MIRVEKLYNNIVLRDDFFAKRVDAQHIPYLETPPDVIDVTVGRQLFVDDFLIEKTDLAVTYHKARKYEGNPILYPEKPWEIEQSPVACPKSGGVWYDEEEKIFKMWYEGGWLHNLCYATSTDGIHWDRPALDEDGTNKILHYAGYEDMKFSDGLEYLRPDSTTVWIDYQGPKEEKYKLFLRNPGGKAPGIVGVSGDGIHFKRLKYTSDLFDRSTVFYNPFRKKWVYSIRSVCGEGDAWFRKRDYRECDDYLEGAIWTENEAHDWLACDDLDFPHPYIGFKPQLYNVDCVGYESIMFGMFQIMYGPENHVCEARGVPKITELIPMFSRDGYHFSRPCRESLIQASLYKGAWDRGYVQSVGGVTVIHGDELWIYYIGFAGDEQYGNQSWITNGIYRNGATGLAKLRRDGFASMDGTGSLLTRKLCFDGKEKLYVNAVGTVQAEWLDENGVVVGQSDVFCGDSTKSELQFDSLRICDWNKKPFRLRFRVDGALYAFGFTDANGDFGGAHAAGLVT